MCGRFTLKTPVLDWLISFLPEHSKHWERLVTEFQARHPELLVPRYNIAPSQTIVVLTQSPHGEPPQLASMRWGLIPSWSDSPNIAFKMINARSETLGEKPSFRGLLRSHRCVVVADGYYEWQRIPVAGSQREQKHPHWIHRPDGGPLAMGGPPTEKSIEPRKFGALRSSPQTRTKNCDLSTTECHPSSGNRSHCSSGSIWTFSAMRFHRCSAPVQRDR